MVLNCIFASNLKTKWPLTLFPDAIDALLLPFAKMWTRDLTVLCWKQRNNSGSFAPFCLIVLRTSDILCLLPKMCDLLYGGCSKCLSPWKIYEMRWNLHAALNVRFPLFFSDCNLNCSVSETTRQYSPSCNFIPVHYRSV